MNIITLYFNRARFFFFFLFMLISIPTGICAQTQEYILQPGDIIVVNVVEHPEFSGRHKIRPDGRINYPVIGEVEVASLTCAQLVKIMEGKLASYINNPVVSVSIEAYYANKIFILGDVRQSGEFQIYEPVDVMKALAMCGGLTNPKTRQVKIIRADGSVVTVNMNEFWGSDIKRDMKKYLLYPGDTLYVPQSIRIPWSVLATLLGIANLILMLAMNATSLAGK